MSDTDRRAGLFPALLKHWRRQRGLSQLDLALAADVSARHISFIETGRSNPSPEMVLRLASALAVPLRQANAMLRAAGHESHYEEGSADLPTAVVEAIALLKSHHEPYPLVVVNRTYRVLDLNHGAVAVLGAVLDRDGAAADPAEVHPLNLARLTFDPDGASRFLVNFDEVGRELLWRIQREVLADPGDGEMQALLDDLLALPTVDASWREADLSVPSEPALTLHLRTDASDLRFLTTITSFQAPQNVAVEHLRIETWFPADEATAAACQAFASR